MSNHENSNSKPVGARMNRRKVIVLTTIALFSILCLLAGLFFHGLPPWPILFWFSVSHIFFCVVIWRVKPFTGPYGVPLAEPELPRLEIPQQGRR